MKFDWPSAGLGCLMRSVDQIRFADAHNGDQDRGGWRRGFGYPGAWAGAIRATDKAIASGAGFVLKGCSD
jgi:hypothetical protein